MSNRTGSAFAPNFYLFQANAAALSLRLRRPHEVMYTEGSACLMGIGGVAEAECHTLFRLHGGILGADSYSTEVTGDFVDRKAAAKMTDSHPPSVSTWETNRLAITTTTQCKVTGFHSMNFESAARLDGPTVRIGQLEFRMEGSNSRKDGEELAIRFKRLSFSSVFINGQELKVSVKPAIFDQGPTFASFKKQFESAAFRKEHGHMVYRPAGSEDSKLHDPRGFCTATVVNKIEWKNPKAADPNIVIDGHSIKVPGYGMIYLGEITIAPIQRRLHMVRVELGCPDGGSGGGGLGCLGGHEAP